MELTKQHKLMMLFLSPGNPVLRRILAIEENRRCDAVSDDDLQKLTGVSRETPKNWAKGKEMRKSKVDGVFTTALTVLDRAAARARAEKRLDEQEYSKLRDAVIAFEQAFQRPDVSVYDVAQLLGMTTTECQMQIDALIYAPWPLLPAVWYDKEPESKRESDIAKQHLARYEGIYLAWVRRYDLWLQCPLRVRYLQPGGAGRFIRCKMNFPIIRPEGFVTSDGGNAPDYWEYDGFLAVRDNKLFWTMEKRQFDRNDYFHFITNTESKSGDKHLTLSGRYLTTGQDKDQSIVTGSVLLHRMFSDDGSDRHHLHYRKIMWTHAKVLTTPDEIQQAEKRWKAYHVRSSDDAESS